MKLHCPHCGVKGSAEDSYSGRKVKCPKCQGVFTVEPDMVLELSKDATSVSTTSVESPLSASAVDTINLAEDRTEQPVTDDAVSVVAVDEQIEIAGDLAGPEVVTATGAEEELDWEDVASEIDLQLDEAEEGGKEEEPIELEEPVDGFDLSEENDAQTGDEASEGRGVEAAEDPAPTMTDEITETAESVESVEEKEEAPEEVSLVEEDQDVEDEPYGVVEEQCWQCGKKESVGESFVAKDGRLYCTVCLPAEEPQETVAAGQEQSSAGTISADDGSVQTSDKNSLGGVIRKTWAKIKNALSS
jgi:hypothetical protein